MSVGVIFVFPWHFCISLTYDAREKLCTLMKKIGEERDTTAASATKTAEEAATAVARAKVLAEMVSPSQETNLTFPWFMVMHPGCGRVYFVERSSNKSQ